MADPFKTETLIAWLEMQPADTRYDYCDPYKCLVAQYLQAHGLGRRDSGLTTSNLFSLGWYDIVSAHPRTFGAALDRARKLLPEKKTDISVIEEILQHAPVGSRLPANVT
jgi:hypothetical protein